MDDQKQRQVLALGRLGWTLRRIQQATAVRGETASAYLKAAASACAAAGGQGWGRQNRPFRRRCPPRHELDWTITNSYCGYVKRASITEAKNRLSALIDRVRHGETIVIEDRGVPVARLESVLSRGADGGEGRLARLEREGLVRRPKVSPPKKVLATPPPRPPGGARLSEAILAERSEGR